VDTLSYKTRSVNKENAGKKWLLVDVEGKPLGRAASEVAKLLRGKHKVEFTPHADTGDYVVVINADKITLSGNKEESKKYIRHTGYPGGQREKSFAELMAQNPGRIFEKAVKGMLPKNKLGRAIYRNLHVYAGTEHNHEGQQPQKYDI
jgi:large subunit ribosomal protein L13